MSEKNLKVEIGQLLKEAHLYPNVRGYVFLRDAIYAKLLNPTLNCAGCLRMVADEHGTNAKNVNSLYSISQLVNELKNRSGVRILVPQSGNKLIIDFGKRIMAVVIDCDVLDE